MARARAFVILALCAWSAAATSLPRQSLPRVATVFVDDLHLPPLETPRARGIVRGVLDRLLKDDSLVELASSGRVRRLPFVYDRDLARIAGELRNVMGSAGTPSANPDPAWVAEQQRSAASAISTAATIVSDLERQANRPRVLIYFSGGYANAGASVDNALSDLAQAAIRAGVVIDYLDPARWNAGRDSKSPTALDRLAIATGGFTLTSINDFARVTGAR
jgi:hypothetical protein